MEPYLSGGAIQRNDLPFRYVTKGAVQTVLEDAGVQSVANWATNVGADAT